MSLVWNNRETFGTEIDAIEKAYAAAAISTLCEVGDSVIQFAREHKGYVNRTGNLFNSIGYIVIQDGKVVRQRFDGLAVGTEAGGDPSAAHQRGYDYAVSVGKRLPAKGVFLVWVAGMEYARYVEAKGYDVIEGSGNWVEVNSRTIIDGLVRKVQKQQ